MKTRAEAISYGLSFPNTYQEAPFDDIKRMIAESYDLVTDSPTKRIYEAVKRIPKGELAGEYAFGGAWKQAQILESEGVVVIEGKVDLEKYRIRSF